MSTPSRPPGRGLTPSSSPASSPPSAQSRPHHSQQQQQQHHHHPLLSVDEPVMLHPSESQRTPVLDLRNARPKVAAPSPLHTVQTVSPNTIEGKPTASSAGPSGLPFPSPPSDHPTTSSSSSFSSSAASFASGALDADGPSLLPPGGMTRSPDSLEAPSFADDGTPRPGRSASRHPPHDRRASSASTARSDGLTQHRKSSAPTLPSAVAGNGAGNGGSGGGSIINHLANPFIPVPKMRLSSLSALEDWPSVRKSSIDSALSNVYSSPSGSRKSSEDSTTTVADDVDIPSWFAALCTAAGSSDAAIRCLYYDKRSAAKQNDQLWNLLHQQRSMIGNLNKDLERALGAKDRYRKKLKDHLAVTSPSAPSDPHPTRSSSRPDEAKSAGPPERDRPPVLHPSPTSTSLPMNPEPSPVAATVTITTTTPSSSTTTTTTNRVGQPHGLTPPASRESSTSNSRRTVRRESRDHVPPLVVVPPGRTTIVVPLSPQGSESAGDVPTVSPEETSPDSRSGEDVSSSTSSSSSVRPSLAEKRSMPPPARLPVLPFLAVTEPSLELEQRRGSTSAARKAPPAPLKLTSDVSATTTTTPPVPSTKRSAPTQPSTADSDDDQDPVEVPAPLVVVERGRRKTREDDDRSREATMMAEEERRSRSKKERSLKSSSSSSSGKSVGRTREAHRAPTSPTHGNSPISDCDPDVDHRPSSFGPVLPRSRSGQPELSRSSSSTWAARPSRVLSSTPLSPGLPMSPRPTDRPPNSPRPRLPRDHPGLAGLASPMRTTGFGLPLSPRALQHSLSFPNMAATTPSAFASAAAAPPPPTSSSADSAPSLRVSTAPEEQPPSSSPAESAEVGGRGPPAPVRLAPKAPSSKPFAPGDHPSTWLTPDGLTSLEVKVSSSRLRPSQSSLDWTRSKIWEPNAVMILAVLAKLDGTELWRVEKEVVSLVQLDQELRLHPEFTINFPDRHLFSGHAPARIDARRAALDQYLEAAMRLSSNPTVASVICEFLKKNMLDVRMRESTSSNEAPATTATTTTTTPAASVLVSPDGRIRKEGYLTKRGKNFGGWKARFFSLDGPVLRYYESPGGPRIGTIRLKDARIEKPSKHSTEHPPSPGEAPDSENEYRHAFLIREPKKKDSSSYIKHLLCAESDGERDEWVTALMGLAGGSESEDEAPSPALSKPVALQTKSKSIDHGKEPSTTSKDGPPGGVDGDALRGMSYENTVQAELPTHGFPEGPSESPHSSSQRAQISAPKNGTKIQDAGLWGNKPQPLNLADRREQKKRSIWGFKARASSEPFIQVQPSPVQHVPAGQTWTVYRSRSNHRPVFGAPLAEAAEFAQPVGIDVYLPAVIYRCIEYLDAKDAASEEGIFRLSGSNVVIKSLRHRFDAEGDVNFLADDQHYDIHAVASLLKMYLRELPSSVLTRELHLDFLAVLELKSKEAKIDALRGLVRRLPRANQSLLRALSSFLITIVDNSEMNKMTVRNVGIVFSPTLNIPAPVLSLFLSDFNVIYGVSSDADLNTNASKELMIAAPALTPDDIRSPRRQLFQDLPTPAHNQSAFPHGGHHHQPSTSSSTPSLGGHVDSSLAFNPLVGFTPLQPDRETVRFHHQSTSTSSSSSSMMVAQGQHHQMPLSVPSATYPRGGPSGTVNNNNDRSVKAKRRESSMMTMDPSKSLASLVRMSHVPGGITEE